MSVTSKVTGPKVNAEKTEDDVMSRKQNAGKLNNINTSNK
jgi:hypothetical protein